jgi:hypothetical protein
MEQEGALVVVVTKVVAIYSRGKSWSDSVGTVVHAGAKSSD